MQTDRRFVQNIDDAHQSTSDLPRQTNSLRFSTGQGRSGSFQRQIVQPALQQKTQPATDFLHRFFGNDLPRRVQLQRFKELSRFLDAECAHLRQTHFQGQAAFFEAAVAGRDPHVASLFVQTLAGTRRTRYHFQMLFHRPTQHGVLCSAVVFQQPISPAFPCATVLVDATASSPAERDVPITGPVQPQPAGVFGHIDPFRLQQCADVHTDDLFNRFRGTDQDVPRPAADLPQRRQKQECSVLNRLLFVDHDR